MFGAITSAIGGLVSEPIKQRQKRKTLKTEHKFELEKLDLKAILFDAGQQQTVIWNEGRPVAP